MKKSTLLLAGIFGLFVFTACEKDDDDDNVDTTQPVITVTAPTEGQHFHAGDTILFTGTITDNVGLSSFKVDIHEGHGHDHKSTSSGDGEWEYEQMWDISGKSYDINEMIIIPTTADSAEYHFLVEALDAAGNNANIVSLDIDIH